MIRFIKALSYFIYTYIACWYKEKSTTIKSYYQINKAFYQRLKHENQRRKK